MVRTVADNTAIIRNAQKYLAKEQIDMAISEWEKLLSESPDRNAYNMMATSIYNSPQQAEAILKLKYEVDTKKGRAVVIGNIGAGKTTLARKLLEELDEENYEAALLVIIPSSVSSEWLFKKFALQLGVANLSDDKIELLGQIYRSLLRSMNRGKGRSCLWMRSRCFTPGR